MSTEAGSDLRRDEFNAGSVIGANKLAVILLFVGMPTTVIAIIWWASFYGKIVREVGGNLGQVFNCLFTSGGGCGFVNALAQFAGVTPYNPSLFWFGVVMLVVGILLKFSLKENQSQQTVASNQNLTEVNKGLQA
jgi:hypothetical protein